MRTVARSTAAAAIAVTLATIVIGCTTEPENAERVVLVNPAYPRDTFDLARPKSDERITCDRYTAEEATAIVGTPAIPTDVGGGNCNYFGPNGLINISRSPDPIDVISRSGVYGERATLLGNSAWIRDFGEGRGCVVDVALTLDRSMGVKANDYTTCEELLDVAEIILSRTPDDPTIEPRVIPELDRYRAVVDPDNRDHQAIDGSFPPAGWTVTSLDDPTYLHPGNTGPAVR